MDHFGLLYLFYQRVYNNLMSLPIYHHFTFDQSNLDKIHDELAKLPLSFSPHLLVIKEIDEFTIPNVLESVQNYFLVNNISFSLPYPTYIITQVFNDQVGLKQFRTIQEAPKFFQIKERRLSGKEQVISNKNIIMEKRLRNVLREHHLSLLKDLGPKLTQLKLEINKHQFLDELYSKIKNKVQINEWKKQK